MAVVANPLYRNLPPDPQPPVAPRELHRRLPGYEATPLHWMPALAADLGVAKVWVKDESHRLELPAFKMLGASWGAYRLLEDRRGSAFAPWSTLDELRDQVAALGPLTLVTATDGNHGRAVARIARLLGLAARVRVPFNTVGERIASIADEGAEVSVSPGNYDQAVAEVAAWAGPDTLVVSDTSWPGYEDVPSWIIDGYSTVFAEIDEQLDDGGGRPTAVVVPTGVGALAAAVVTWARRIDATVIAVEPVDAACVLASVESGRIVTIPGELDSIMAGLNCGTPSAVAWPRVSSGVRWLVTVTDDEARAGMRDFAAVGIVAGESGAAALAGARAAVAGGALGLGDRVVLLSTEGATDVSAYRTVVGRTPDEISRAPV